MKLYAKILVYLLLPFAYIRHGFKKAGKFARLQAKPVMACLVAVALLLSGVPLTAFAAESQTPVINPTHSTPYIAAMGTPIFIEAGTTSGYTVVYYYSSGTKTYLTDNGDSGQDLTNFYIYGGQGLGEVSFSCEPSITMNGGSVKCIKAGNFGGSDAVKATLIITGGSVKYFDFDGNYSNSGGGTSTGLVLIDVEPSYVTEHFTGIYKVDNTYIAKGAAEIPSNFELTVGVGETLSVPQGASLTNNGTISVNGTLASNGVISNNGTIHRNAAYITTDSFDVDSLSVWVGDSAVTDFTTEYVDGKLYIYNVTGDIEVSLNGKDYRGVHTIGSSAELTAVPEVIYYTVTFKSNDGSAVPAQTVPHNGKVTKPANPTREGFTFAGWFSDMVLSSQYDFDTAVTGNMTLYAGWYIKYYTVSFDSNGGSEVSSQEVAYRYTAYNPSEPTRKGYNFVGWFTDETLTTEYSFNTPVTGDMTLYAKWEKLPAEAPTVTPSGNLTLTYKDYTDQQVSVSVTEKTGYTYFYQWYDGNNQPISEATNSTYTVPNDLTADSYSYYCVVTAKRDDNGETQSSKSSTIFVTVNKAALTADDFEFEGPDILVFHPANFKRATVTPKDRVTGIGEITVQYFDEQGQPHSYAVDAGTYTVRINVTEGDNYLPADGLTANGWTFTITKGTQNAPSGIVGVAETVYGKNDGKITGVYYEMEYRKASETDEDYKAITGTEITGLAAGTYYVRMKETNNLFATDDTTVTITAGRKLAVTVPQNQIGYTLTANKTDLEWHGGTTLVFALADGYSKTDEFSVSATGATLTDNGNGTYTISNAEDTVIVTVKGVADTSAPEAEISISTNRWTQFLNDITFELFFKETQDVTITATDKGSGVDKIYYLISETELTKEAVEALANVFWKEYDATNKPSINPDKECIVYIKVIDKAQNVKVISSDGLVFDATAPTLEGIENGKTYYGDLTVIIPADQFGDIEKVTLDGQIMNFAEGTYGRIPADNAVHTVVATDKAGNKTEYKITVYKVYEITFNYPTFELGFPVNYGESFNAAHPDTVQDMVIEKDYHTFIGWYESTDGGTTLKDTPYDFNAQVTGDVTLYPLFEIYTYTVTFMDENGVYQTVTVKHGEKVTMPEAPKKDGYTVRWEKVLDTVTGDVTVKAVYTEISATDRPSSVQTGDNSNLWLWVALLFVSGGCLFGTVIYKKKQEAE